MCRITHSICESILLLAFFMFCLNIVVKFQKEKKKDFLFIVSVPMVSLAEYFDLFWCFHNDFWRPFVLSDDTNDLCLFTEVVGIWRIRES